MNILITEFIWPEGIQILESFGEVIYDPDLWNNSEALSELLESADTLIIRNQTKVDERLLDSAPNLKVIGRLGVGLDNMDIDAAKRRNIEVIYAKNANANSVAEYVFAAMFDASRKLNQANQDVQAGNWNRKLFTGSELAGKTLGLIGLGEIAKRVAIRAKSFGIRVLGYSPSASTYDFSTELGVEICSLGELLAQSDYISLHIPLTEKTKGFISMEQLRQMKHSAFLMNTSRGGTVDEKALVEAVQTRQIAGAYLDVIENEPIRENNPILYQPNIFITPHVAGLTEESQLRTSVLVAEEVAKVLQGKTSVCRVP
ncbi:hydroxyacid dehydrogenase [Radiobacillus kanasensis]|uniref:hydroxyacid dehydrogenase n=1 Tax=Radiobacillus kanasensis TaxID=2844358 RepID=UPI001E461742|nr:hydroxyacid dehydrogenase [Radiobacillus kanasensis]UFT98790.1 hydroxyacid dehydrogenase [Radiobacillus kanasensis]